jgi:hypothetical protein
MFKTKMLTLYRNHTNRFAVGQAAIVAMLHMFLALVATYPLIGSMGTAVVGGGDTTQNMWNLWWERWAALRGDWIPYFTNMLYAPSGVSLAYHPLGLLNGWLGIVLQDGLGMNLLLTYNTLVIVTFIASGLATFYLVYFLVQNYRIAFVASLIFTYAPIRISRVSFGNLEMFSTEFIPLTALFIIQLLQTRKRRYSLYAALTIAGTAWLSLYLALGTAILIVLLSGLILIENRHLIVLRLKLLSMFGLITLVLIIPVVAPMIQNFQSFQDQSDQLSASNSNSADLLGFFIPDNETEPIIKRLSPDVADIINRAYGTFSGNPYEKTVFIGYSVLVLVLLAGLLERSRLFWQWVLIGGMFFVFCLGPQLHVAGKSILEHLPYEWLSNVPLIGFGRVPSRLAIFLMLALAVVSSQGLKTMEARYAWFKWGTVAIGIVVFVEFLAIPMPLDRRFAEIPSYYWQLRNQGNSESVILDIPIDLIGAQGPAGNYMLYQIVHQKPIVSGYISRTPSQVLQLFQRPFLSELRARIYNDKTPYHFDQQILSQASRDLRELDIRYVILHRDALPPEDFQVVYTALVSVLAQPQYEDGQIQVWELHR